MMLKRPEGKTCPQTFDFKYNKRLFKISINHQNGIKSGNTQMINNFLIQQKEDHGRGIKQE